MGRKKLYAVAGPYFADLLSFWLTLTHPQHPTTFLSNFIFPIFLLPMLECACPEIAENVPTVCVHIRQIPDSECQEHQTPATYGTTNIGFLKN